MNVVISTAVNILQTPHGEQEHWGQTLIELKRPAYWLADQACNVLRTPVRFVSSQRQYPEQRSKDFLSPVIRLQACQELNIENCGTHSVYRKHCRILPASVHIFNTYSKRGLL